MKFATLMLLMLFAVLTIWGSALSAGELSPTQKDIVQKPAVYEDAAQKAVQKSAIQKNAVQKSAVTVRDYLRTRRADRVNRSGSRR